MKRKLLYSAKADELYGAIIAKTKDGEYRFTCNCDASKDWRDDYFWDDTVEVVELEETEFSAHQTQKFNDHLYGIKFFELEPYPPKNKKYFNEQDLVQIREWAEQNLPLLKRNKNKREAGTSSIPRSLRHQDHRLL